jgi:hypothetical protein
MGPEWLWHGIISDWTAALLIAAGSALLAYLTKRGSRGFAPVLYGLAGCALVASTLYFFTAFAALPKQQPQITPKNVESNIRA